MKSFKNGAKWIYWFTLIVAIVIVYKVLDNFTGIGEWLSNLIKVIKPFLMAILVAYLLYIPCRKIEGVYRKSILLKYKAPAYFVCRYFSHIHIRKIVIM